MDKYTYLKSKRVLVVDDELDVADMMGRSLSRFCTVEIVYSSLEALELYRDDPERFDLIVTDWNMPELFGDELIDEIMHIKPIPVIAVSGLPLPYVPFGTSATLVKPFLISELVSCMECIFCAQD